MKVKIPKKCYKRVRQLTSSKLNTMKTTNFRVVSLVRYSAEILKRRMDELEVKERRQKAVTMNIMCTICRVY